MGGTGRRSSPRAPDSGHYELPSDAGGRRAATFYTIIRTCVLNGIEPEAYLRDVLARIGDYPINRLHELLPWNIAGQATRNLAA
jgi:transposase